MSASNKRKRDDEQEAEKKVVQEGMSWWNCLMLDMPYENTRPRAVPVARQQPSSHQQQIGQEQSAKNGNVSST